MKYLAAFSLMLALAGPVVAQSGKAGHVLEQRRAALGTDVRKFRHLVPERVEASTQTVYYTSKRENLQVGGYTVTGISYGFYKDKLCSIELRVMGDANCKGIHNLLLSEYGPSQRVAAKSENWTDPQVTLRYTEVPQGFATIVLASKTLMEQRLAESKVPAYHSA
ncbi:hypothetical protein [Hymenobacter cellulosivorans]|uniref:Uncharacterized protein n=1 Tax=Hymenobacter cellulosivorans TaxID=2932249 RepID=A0ABY4F9B4_9BACT|nr:hypothetical protein [Hymenobacter cellulosivorans]UOQ53115.1 hypothetical protein MUN80_25700 [Hymenobacter cellulosivorans]